MFRKKADSPLVLASKEDGDRARGNDVYQRPDRVVSVFPAYLSVTSTRCPSAFRGRGIGLTKADLLPTVQGRGVRPHSLFFRRRASYTVLSSN